LIVYEHLLTLEDERRVIWARPWSIPTILFLLNRYLLLLFGLSLLLWGFITWETDSIIFLIADCTLVVFMALRTHTINNYRWFWTILLILLGCVDIPPNISTDRCNTPVMIAVSIASFIGSVIVVVITWYRTAGLVLASRKVNMRRSLGYYLLRDGSPSIFFVVVSFHSTDA
ncbi:hypothetical protein L226DRAFT_459825, partial [Lentinus tigrinus ALCF2SS1-7]|uniref:uncharacterized protein n=1 Tax=Lentinus tigrinus ALCF2SS1-7 TaxID=1328758 RepID=UPI001165D74D